MLTKGKESVKEKTELIKVVEDKGITERTPLVLATVATHKISDLEIAQVSEASTGGNIPKRRETGSRPIRLGNKLDRHRRLWLFLHLVMLFWKITKV